MMTPSSPASLVRTRFAPSPTGLLHAGSMMTAVGSYLEARSRGGEWWVRMEDLDPPREMPGAADHILRTLEAFGFEWDGEVVYQSQRHHLYQAALQQLVDSGHVYPCSCSRKSGHAPLPRRAERRGRLANPFFAVTARSL